jgi:hypothetical protein
MKRLPKVATEMALHVLAYNLTRVMNIMGIQPLMAAIRGIAKLEKIAHAATSPSSDLSWQNVLKQPRPKGDIGLWIFALHSKPKTPFRRS